MNILVTGGAGYIGSVVVEQLLQDGHSVYVIDSLATGHRDALGLEAIFREADIGGPGVLDDLFNEVHVEAVVHLAGDSLIGVSMKDPGKFFRNNLSNGIALLDCMARHGVTRMVFSSSAAVYGVPEQVPVHEDAPLAPVNPYGESKLLFERIAAWYEKIHGVRCISLRYFNAAGATETHGEDHRPETHLIPNLLSSFLDSHSPLRVYGTDYPTPDGSCVRDYVHVSDIAAAHVLALDRFDSLRSRVFNLGNGKGHSVLQVISAAERVTGRRANVEYCGRRAGDPPVLVASSERAKAELGWIPRLDSLEAILGSAWQWRQRHPRGYAQ